MKTPFDSVFDFDRSGSLDWMERGARDATLISCLRHSEQGDRLRNAGLDSDEFSPMSDFKQIEALNDAGLNPDVFDF